MRGGRWARHKGLLGGLMLATALPVQALDWPVAAPEIRVGDTWQYRHGRSNDPQSGRLKEVKVIRVTGPTVVTQEQEGGATVRELAYDGEWNAQDDGRGVYEPPLPLLRFPLRRDSQWQARVERFPANSSQRAVMVVNARVVAAEWVQVPAGRYEAVRVEAEVRSEAAAGQGGLAYTVTSWYAPGINSLVRRSVRSRPGAPLEMDDVVELVANKRGTNNLGSNVR